MHRVQIGVAPNNFCGFGIQTDGAIGAELTIKHAVIDDRSGRCIAVVFVNPLRVFQGHQLDVLEYLAAIPVDADGVEDCLRGNNQRYTAGICFQPFLFFCIGGSRIKGGRQPNLIAFDDRR